MSLCDLVRSTVGHKEANLDTIYFCSHCEEKVTAAHLVAMKESSF